MKSARITKANGDITFTLTGASRDVLALTDADDDEILNALIEAHGLEQVNPEDVGALTSSPIIAQDAEFEMDDGYMKLTGYSNLWWYPNYAIRGPIDELKETGSVTFTKGS